MNGGASIVENYWINEPWKTETYPLEEKLPQHSPRPKMTRFHWWTLFLVRWMLITGVFYSVPAWAQQREVIEGGRFLFDKFCSTCHGLAAKGDGPLSHSLSPRPADLTTMTRRHGGAFPFWEAYRIIDGRQTLESHGTRDMPVFGTWFRIPDDEVSIESEWADQVRGRIWQLLSFLESIQER